MWLEELSTQLCARRQSSPILVLVRRRSTISGRCWRTKILFKILGRIWILVHTGIEGVTGSVFVVMLIWWGTPGAWEESRRRVPGIKVSRWWGSCERWRWTSVSREIKRR